MITVDFTDSCYWCTTNVAAGTNGPGLKYKHLSGSGARSSFFPGPDGLGSYFFSSTVGTTVFQKILQTQFRWMAAFSLNVINARNSESIIFSWLTASIAIASLTLGSDGKLRLYQGGNGSTIFGSLVYVSNTILPINQWNFIDIDWSFPGSGNGSVSLYINDVLDTNVPNTPSASNVAWGGTPDRFQIVWNNNSSTGYGLADIVAAHADPSDNHIGPCRVTFIQLTADQLITGWTPTYTATPQPNSVDTINGYQGDLTGGVAPHLNYSYISTATPLAEDLFGGISSPCFAGILAVSVNACVTDPNNGNCDLVVRPVPSNGLDTIVGGITCPPVQPPGFGSSEGYLVLQAISQLNNGAAWTDGDIENAWWGIVCVTGTPSCCQLFLEKVTTRRSLPFSCGQIGSYAL